MVVFYVEGCGVSSAEYHVHLVGGNRLYAFREFCGVHSWQMEQDVEGVKVLLCHSHLVWVGF